MNSELSAIDLQREAVLTEQLSAAERQQEAVRPWIVAGLVIGFVSGVRHLVGPANMPESGLASMPHLDNRRARSPWAFFRMLLVSIACAPLSACITSEHSLIPAQASEEIPGLAGRWSGAGARPTIVVRRTDAGVYEFAPLRADGTVEPRQMLITGVHLDGDDSLVQLADARAPDCKTQKCDLTVVRVLPKALVLLNGFIADCLSSRGWTSKPDYELRAGVGLKPLLAALRGEGCKHPTEFGGGRDMIGSRRTLESRTHDAAVTLQKARQDFRDKKDDAVMDALQGLAREGDPDAAALLAQAAMRSGKSLAQGLAAAEDAAEQGQPGAATLASVLALQRLARREAPLSVNPLDDTALRWAGQALAMEPGQAAAQDVVQRVSAAYCARPGLQRHFKDAAHCSASLQQAVAERQKLAVAERSVNQEIVDNLLEQRRVKAQIADRSARIAELDAKEAQLKAQMQREIDAVVRRARSGEPSAMFELGWFYEFGMGDIKIDYAAARSWYEKAAAAGEPRAASRLRMMRH